MQNTTPSDEKDMLSYCQTGDMQAFERLYDKYNRYMLNVVMMQLNNACAAEELVHDAWASIIQYKDKYTESAKFKTFVFAILKNKIIDYRRTWLPKQAAQVDTEDVPELFDDSNNTETLLQNQQTSHMIKQALATLSEEKRLMVIMYYYQGFTVPEIAQMNNEPLEKAKSRMRSAKKGIQAYLNQHGITLETVITCP